MQEVIQIIEKEGNNVVSARELYSFLEVKERFSRFMERNLEYGFQENVDYTTYQMVHPSNLQEINDYLLTLDCAKSILLKSKSFKAKELLDFFGFEGSVKIIKTRFEISFSNMLLDVLKESNIEVISQYSVLNYRIDFYLPEYNLAIEYDEEGHKFSIEKDTQRQSEIENLLKCKFIRLDYKDSDAKNVGKVISKILNK